MRLPSLGIIFISSFFSLSAQDKMELKDWGRPYFEKSLYDSFTFLIIYGEFEVDFNISAQEYPMVGIPIGIELMHYGPENYPQTGRSFLEGYLWERLKEEDPDLAIALLKAPECFVIRGSVKDTNNLNYFRDIISLSTYLLDHGGVGIFDPQMFRFWSKEEWRQKNFEPQAPLPRNHVMILQSQEESGAIWYHTRGMWKFGRPDLSVHGVKPEYEKPIQDLINRFIEFQAFGGIIEDGQKIKLESLPAGMWCENKGDFDDPDFNNKHVEIHWK